MSGILRGRGWGELALSCPSVDGSGERPVDRNTTSMSKSKSKEEAGQSDAFGRHSHAEQV